MIHLPQKKVIAFIFVVTLLGVTASKTEYSLEEIIQLGLQSNPLILAKQNDLLSQESLYRAARQFANPSLSITTGQGKNYEETFKRNTRSIVIEQEIENPFKRHARLQAAKANWQASKAAYDSLKLDLISLLKEHSYRLLFLEQQQEIARKKLESIKKMASLIQAKASLGEVKPLDALKLQVEAQRAQNELQKINSHLEMAKMELNSLLNNRLPDDFRIKGRLEYKPLPLEESSLIQRALLIHPHLQEKKARVYLVENELAVLRWGRFPDLSLSGFSSREIDGINKGIGISFSLPLWNFKSREIAALQYSLAKEQQELSALQLEITLEVRLQLRRLQLVTQTIQLFQESILKQAEESLRLASLSYQEGEIALLDYLDAQRTYYAVLNEYHEQVYQWHLEKTLLEKTIGEQLQ